MMRKDKVHNFWTLLCGLHEVTNKYKLIIIIIKYVPYLSLTCVRYKI